VAGELLVLELLLRSDVRNAPLAGAQ